MITLDVTLYDPEKANALSQEGWIHNATIITNGELQYILRKQIADIPNLSKTRVVLDARELGITPEFQVFNAEAGQVGKNLFLNFKGMPTTRLGDQILALALIGKLKSALNTIPFELEGKSYWAFTWAASKELTVYLDRNASLVGRRLPTNPTSIAIDIANHVAFFSIESYSAKWLDALVATSEFICE